jgi:hypothetical protein
MVLRADRAEHEPREQHDATDSRAGEKEGVHM